MQLISFLLPLIIQLNIQQQNFRYEWAKYGISFNVSVALILEIDDDLDMFDAEDESGDIWIMIDRYSFDELDKEMLQPDLKAATKHYCLNDGGVEKVKDGGRIPNVPEGYYMYTFEDESYIFLGLIVDRKNKVVYEIEADDFSGKNKNILVQFMMTLLIIS